jgi:phosphopantetheine--protein transferase-like protein
MNDHQKIRSVVARFFNVAESAVTDDFIFPAERLQSSAGRATFHAALKRLAGADLASAYTANSYRQLLQPETAKPEGNLEAATTPVAPVARTASSDSNFSVGIDVEALEVLPQTDDFWSEPFYQENFSAQEVAHCVRQPNPRLSLCGIWSAKEATIKCYTGQPGLRPSDVTVGHDSEGRPLITQIAGTAAGLLPRFHLSISHAGSLSVAVCVYQNSVSTLSSPSASDTSPRPASHDIKPPPGYKGNSRRWIGIACLLGFLSLAIWLFKVWRAN